MHGQSSPRNNTAGFIIGTGTVNDRVLLFRDEGRILQQARIRAEEVFGELLFYVFLRSAFAMFGAETDAQKGSPDRSRI